MPKRRKPGLADRRTDEHRAKPADYRRAKHRVYGPPMAPTVYDMTPSEFTAIKGAGGRT